MTTILLLEDNNDLARMIRQILEWRGFQVQYGVSGEAGITILDHAETLPDLIMCDLVMPGMDGYDVLGRVRANPTWASIPFIIMSANATDADQEMAARNGANGYLVKPFGIADLDTLLRQFGFSPTLPPSNGTPQPSSGNSH